MSNHLPECPAADPVWHPDYSAPCMCDRLRALEQRVREDEFSYNGDIDTAYGQGWDEALDAAREAVAALPPSPLPERWGVRTAMNFRGDVLAAIDALREGQK